MATFAMYMSGMYPKRKGWDGYFYNNVGRAAESAQARDSAVKLVNDWEMLKKVLENTSHNFVWIITKMQWPIWETKLDEFGLKEYVVFEMPYFVSNYNYPTAQNGRKLRLVIMKGKG